MFFKVSLIIALIVNVIAIICQLASSFADSNSTQVGSFREAGSQCIGIGLLYFIFAWLISDSTTMLWGKTTYEQVIFWMMVTSIGWMIAFAIALFSRLCGKEEASWSGAVKMGILYFALAYLLR